jgi:vitamin B12 transporter
VVDLRAEYKLAADWRLQGTIGNAFDHEYETARFYNQEGRSVFVTLKYQPKR